MSKKKPSVTHWKETEREEKKKHAQTLNPKFIWSKRHIYSRWQPQFNLCSPSSLKLAMNKTEKAFMWADRLRRDRTGHH